MANLPGQQLNAPRYNHPCGDLLNSGRREEYINICVPLYKASLRGDLEAARVILEGREYLVRYSITEHKETPLHVAAAAHKPQFVKYLVDMMTKDDLKLQNEEDNNAFCVAATAGNHRMAMIMLQKNGELLTIRGSGNMMPLYLAAYQGHYGTMAYLYNHSHRMSSDGWTDDDRNNVFLKCIEIDCFDGALRILNDREELPQDKYVWNVLHVLAQKPRVFNPKSFNQQRWQFSSEMSRFEYAVTGKATRHLRQPGKEREAATQLLRKIWKKIVVKTKDEIDVILRGPVVKIGEKDTYPSQILFVAAENGNANFLAELIREYPDLIRRTNDDGQTIFHIGLSYHHFSIYTLLRGIGTLKATITQLKDKDGNTLLHSVVSKNTASNSYAERRMGPAFQLQLQQSWFRRVRAMVPPSYEQLRNAAGQTPNEVFTHNHRDLITNAKKWIKEINNQRMVVAALVTTISFSAAFTIPGGYNQDTGFPMFLRNTPFTAFLIFDGLSFILSSLSILIFLHLSHTRNPRHYQFRIGYLVLLCSIITLMAAFSASFFVLYHNKLPIIMTSLATLPIIIYFRIQMCAVAGSDEFPYTPYRRRLYNYNPRF